MGILLNGNKPSKIIYNGAETSLYYNGSKIWPEDAPYDPYNPLNLPANTVRVRTSDGNVPRGNHFESATLVAGTTDVYDVYKSGTSLASLFDNASNVIEVLGANTTDITDMSNMFSNCTSLTTVAVFDTSLVYNMYNMFNNCQALTAVPLFNTSRAMSMSFMFNNCYYVESGALALYQQASSQVSPPSHGSTFKYCGVATQSGAAELAQIPSDWK